MNAAKELTADEIHRLEWLLGTIEAKRLVGETLTPEESALRTALEELTAAEADARTAFASFYTTLPMPGVSDDAQVALPGDVARRINRWVEARRAWDQAVTEILREAPPERSVPVRTGPRIKANLPDFLRVPTALPARDTLALLFAPHLWKADTDGLAVSAQRGETQVRLECDDLLGLGPQEAIRQIARHGASVAQTFFALIALWLERNPGASHETYMTAYASDLLRFQRRKEAGKGGYHRDDILAKGRDLYLLSRISVPTGEAIELENGNRVSKRASLGRLLSVEALEIAETQGESGTGASVVRFRYHPGREVHQWLAGKDGQYAVLSGKLLTYHPVRQKYQILLGFCLAYCDQVQRRYRQEYRRIPLPTLLKLAAIDVPNKRISEFLTTIEEALAEIGRDGLIPGLKMVKPANWTELLAQRETRAIIAGSEVVFPPLALPATGTVSLPS
ncbi:MAG: hypothetical protein SFU56_20875 [Capsulimonadales bacterium]|nr:hypothetical protein [Capsulimonadales bacterium]